MLCQRLGWPYPLAQAESWSGRAQRAIPSSLAQPEPADRDSSRSDTRRIVLSNSWSGDHPAPAQHGGSARQSITWQTEHVGATHIPDVFTGQVLGLHPLSGFFMKDPALCAIAGRFLTCERYDEVMKEGRSENCPQYWDLIGAVLSAANLYRMALDNQGQQRAIHRRGSHHWGGDIVKLFAARPDEELEASLLEKLCRRAGHPVSELSWAGETERLYAGQSGRQSGDDSLQLSFVQL